MKKRNILLDFTSLLDVTLIIIFFFVIFSHLDGEENKALVDNKVKELEEAIYVAEERESEAQELKEVFENGISILEESDERQAANVEAMFEYMQGVNIKIILDMKEVDWTLRILHNGKVLDTIRSNENIGEKIRNAIKNAGYKKNDTIFCDFVFDGSLPGTASAYRKISRGLSELIEEYEYVYSSETDLSIGE